MFSLASLLRPELSELVAYEPHPGTFNLRLDANESPMVLSATARAGLEQAIIPQGWNLYPDPLATELREIIATRSAVNPEQVLAGIGSDEIIALLVTTLDRPRGRAPAATVVTPTPTFVMYRHNARVRGMRVLDVPLDKDWDLDVTAMRRAIEMGQPNLVFLAVPNNPTGTLFSEDRVRAVIEAAPDALVILDEAYVDFSSRSYFELHRAYPNVAIMRTISKIGFASLRIGWLIGSAELIGEVNKARQPYNLPLPCQQAATFILRQLESEIEDNCRTVIAERNRLGKGLEQLGFQVAPSETNFLWVGTRLPAEQVFKTLASRGILVRSFHSRGGRLANRIRITVGLPEDNTRLLEEIAACA